MIWPLICVIIGIILSVKEVFEFSNGFLGYCGDVIWFLFLIIIYALVGATISFLVGWTFPKKWVAEKKIDLVSLRESNGLKGHFFLGTGNINNNLCYFFYKKDSGKEGYRPGKLDAGDNVLVVEWQRESGVLETWTREFKNRFAWLMGFHGQGRRYKFSIPKGSLKQEFHLG